ncbi:uncharacterized protein LOC142557087 [Dermacentor variabilis]|uniref:uncharacterized protein LOC142557087 n=1 Tax=Dermacentor variabilis TaxID=34621 RepID=UPI003F5C2E19
MHGENASSSNMTLATRGDASEETHFGFGWRCFKDVSASSDQVTVLRMDITGEETAGEWVKRYSAATLTQWCVYSVSKEEKCQKMVYHKTWRCHLHGRKKVSTGCTAMIDVKIKKVNRNTKKNDKYLRWDPPLCAVVRLAQQHNHPVESADALRLLRCNDETRALFYGYFSEGLSPLEAMRLHEGLLAAECPEYLVHLTSGASNPKARTVYYLYKKWQQEHHGAVIEPFTKLREKVSKYLEQGVDVRICNGEDSGSWAVLVVTAVMQRAQLLESSSETIFIDSTTSCDTTHSTVTVMMTATAAGAVPIGVVIHNTQTTEGYANAFQLFKSAYPLCFGGLDKPGAFMTNNSAAQKAALRETWPEVRQLLYHFHMAQSEWRWLTMAKHGVSPEQRKQLLAVFQKIMYADTPELLEVAKEGLHCQGHAGYIAHVETILENEEEWVLLFRLNMKTRGRDTNSYSEASVRVLKDIVSYRTEAFSVVALVEFVAVVFEKYVQDKIWQHATQQVADHRLFYESPLTILPEEAQPLVVHVGDDHYTVSSCTKKEKSYDVFAQIGLCSCRSGQRGAFCKHQALIFKMVGATFPNAPLLSKVGRHELGWLAFDKECPNINIFDTFQSHSIQTAGTPIDAPATSPAPPPELASPGPSSQASPAAQSVNKEPNYFHSLAMSFQRLESLAGDDATCKKYAAKLSKQLEKVTSKETLKDVMMTMSAAVCRATKRRTKTCVLPTCITRRRLGLNRGCKHVLSGRPPKISVPKLPRHTDSLHMSVE